MKDNLRETWNKLLEMPAWKDDDKNIADQMGGRCRQFVDQLYRMRREEPIEEFAIGDLNAVVYRSREGNVLRLHLFDNDEKEVGAFHWYKEGRRHWATTSVALANEYQGKGIGFTVYTHMIDKYMHTLMSDETLTGETGKGSFDLWVKLGRHYPYKYVYNTSSFGRYKVNGFTRDMMEEGGEVERFVVSQYEL